MFWLPLLLRYATAVATREAMRSSRWNHEKTAVVALVTPFVVLIALGWQVWWLTGRGRLRRLFGWHMVIADPFPKTLPRTIREQLDAPHRSPNERREGGR
jgi:hypothetical protein